MRNFAILISLILSITSAHGQVDCEKYTDKYVPTDLNDAITYLSCVWKSGEKESFRNDPEEEALVNLHFGAGRSIRNAWGLWQGENALVKHFNAMDIYHPDDMSSIIFTSFHRSLNGLELDLEGQIRKYKEYWRLAEENEREWKVENELRFENFQVGDMAKMNFALLNEKGKARLYFLPRDRESFNFRYEGQQNCAVTGIVKGKKVLNDDDYIFEIEITALCGPKKIKLGDRRKVKLAVGDILDYNISYYNIERL